MTPDDKLAPPTAQDAEGYAPEDVGPDYSGWLSLARQAFRNSTSFVDSNYRKTWEDGIRAFNNQHPSDSKYNHPAYEKRSRLYRPKTRTVIRKNEAAAASAFFSNMDVVSVTPQDQSNKAEVASAAVMKELLQYRLTKSIPWFQIVLGGLQDAQNVGVAAAHTYWSYKEDESGETEEAAPSVRERGEQPMSLGKDGPAEGAPQQAPQRKPKVLMDKPCVDLIPIENIRIDPGANWVDPVNTSPYFIHMIPMYILDVKEKMESGEWFPLPDEVIARATEDTPDSTRSSRSPGRDDAYSQGNSDIDDYSIVWVQRHIHRKDGIDWEFHVMGDRALLTSPVPLKERVFHGMRPYVMGVCILETHKIYPASVPQLGKGLQDEVNEIANQRIDNVKFVLNKKWFVKRGKDADVSGLIRNVPGGVVMLDDPEKDVREVTWPDVTQSAFEEQNRLNLDMDELMGNFNPSQLMTQGSPDTPFKSMSMLSHSNGTLTEYLLKTFSETFVLPILRQLMHLEQEYETDRAVMAIAGKNANIVQLYGIDEVTDQLLETELTLTVNVGMGATDPMQKLNKFLTAMNSFMQMMRTPTPGINMQEVGKEVFGHLGYADGSRFFTSDNPQVVQLQSQLQQAMQMIQQLQAKVEDKQTAHKVKMEAAKLTAQTQIQTTAMHEENENKRSLATHFRALMEHQDTMKLEQSRPRGAK
jgi:hypothetical protein